MFVQHTPELGVAVTDVRVDSRGMQAEARVAGDVSEHVSIRYLADPKLALEHPRLSS
jgi:hypothetical protein